MNKDSEFSCTVRVFFINNMDIVYYQEEVMAKCIYLIYKQLALNICEMNLLQAQQGI